MHRIKSLIFSAIFVLPICTSQFTYYLEITPKESTDIYQTNVNETVTFQATGFQKDQETDAELQVGIDKLWWNFDKGILVKVDSNPSSITLRTVKSGVSKLTAIAMIGNYSCTKFITVLVKETAQANKTTPTLQKKRR